MSASIPNFDDLPPVEGQPKGFAWGVFDKDGKKDILGTLNFITPDAVKAAAAEVKDGISVSLNWPLNAIKFPLPGRTSTQHKAHTLASAGMEGIDGWDDELSFNTQMSSQWDSLCHVTHGTTTSSPGTTYNGFRPTVEALNISTTAQDSNVLPTIDHWHSRGCIVARGVLIDYKRYVEDCLKQTYHPLDGHRVTVEEVEKVAEYQGVEFREGDVLILRTGYTEVLEAPTQEDFAKLMRQTMSGLHGVEESVRWVWNHRIAACAGDGHAFEAMPALKEDGTPGGVADLYLHRHFLNGIGMPIGELWDLKALGETCKRLGRYSFLLTSVPLNHPGLVASPPNAVAVF